MYSHHGNWKVGIDLPQNLVKTVMVWSMPLIPETGSQRQDKLCEFEDSLVVYIVSSRAVRAVHRDPVSNRVIKCTGTTLECVLWYHNRDTSSSSLFYS